MCLISPIANSDEAIGTNEYLQFVSLQINKKKYPKIIIKHSFLTPLLLVSGNESEILLILIINHYKYFQEK